MLEVICMKWGDQYGARHVNTLKSMLSRHLPVPHRLTCFTDDPAGVECRCLPLPATVKGRDWTGRKRRYIKLWAYSKEIGQHLDGSRLLLLDLDIVICGDLRPIVDRGEPIVFWDDPHQHTPYNSSVVLMDVGARSQVWDDFDPEASPQRCEVSRIIGHDQCWAGIVLGPGEATWTSENGVYSMRNDIMTPNRKQLPANARIVVFHGPRDPADQDLRRRWPWIVEHWQ